MKIVLPIVAIVLLIIVFAALVKTEAALNVQENKDTEFVRLVPSAPGTGGNIWKFQDGDVTCYVYNAYRAGGISCIK